MKVSTTAVTLGLCCALAALSGCATKESKRCDHTGSETFTVQISVTGNRNEKPKVDKEEISACHRDNIAFESATGDFDFVIEFIDDTPFKAKKIKSDRGKAKKEVKFKPKKDEKKFKYEVTVDGYPKLDPYIIIKKR